ncbi:MAG: ABC transporter permease, partial [Blastocatellia bacterium]
MRLLSYLRSLRRNLLRRGEIDNDLNREVDSYLEMLIARNVEAGMNDREARRAALIELGGGQQVKERVTEVRAGHAFESILRDIRYALRTLGKTPAFTAVAVLTLGFGVGANSAIFSVINGVLLKSLPFQNPDRLAVVRTTYTGGITSVTSWKDFDDFRTQSKSFEQMAMYDRSISVLSGNGDSSVVRTGVAGVEFFEMFRVQPMIGRPFSQQDYQPNAPKVVALGEGFWKQQFGADPKVLGRTLTVDGHEAAIVSVVPDLFDTFMDRPQIWAPLPRAEQVRSARHLWAIGRLRPGVKVSQASKEITGIADSLQKAYSDSNEGWSATVLSLQESIVGDTRPMMLILLGVVALVLLVACANIANLLLARGATRRKEVAVRSALGASRARLIRQFLAEGLVLSVLGGAVAIVLAAGAMKMLVGIAPPEIPRLSDIVLDRTVVTFTFILALSNNFLFGLLPAVRLSGTGLNGALKEAGRGVRGDRGHSRLRRLLVVSELAISLVLLIGCGLLVRSFYDVTRVNPGFNAERVIAAKVSLPDLGYNTDDSVAAFFHRLNEGLTSLPAGSAAICTTLPLQGGGLESWGFISREGETRSPKTTVASQVRRVGPGYFHTMSIPLLA